MELKKKHSRILAIDGGGIRGIIPAVVLADLEKKLQSITKDHTVRLADYFDLIAGTSTGGILSCCYLLEGENQRPKYTAEEILNLYFKHGEQIFNRSIFHKIRTAGGVLDEKYSDNGLRETLDKYMGNERLRNLLKPTLITAYDIERRKAHFFTKHDAHKKGNNFFVKDVAWSTSAAPTYFECAYIQDDLNRNYALIDGGVFANNPTLCAYAEARKIFKKFDTEKAVTASDMLILSIGTGSDEKRYPYNKAKDWGQLEWVKPLLDIMMSGVAETVDYQVRQIYDAIERPNQYLRINAPLSSNVNHNMDDASRENMEGLRLEGEALVKQFDAALQEFAVQLTATKGCDLIA
ncbi:MAG TPA: CBASS cGAMP-activated phospholipase [Marinilabiliaceae bacterium]|nr:CBASS cGAMP-activated phospholipase [Marinilabiliaceae bacterium]